MVEWLDPEDPQTESIYELYDYQEDPLETQNLANTQNEVVEKLKAILKQHPRAKPQAR